MIPYGRQDVTTEDIEAVIEVLQSEFLTQGPQVPKFEAALQSKFTSEFAVAVNSATSALHIACMALELGPADRVWTSPITFVASANCARYCNAKVDFVDIDLTTYNICVIKLEEKLEQAKISGTLPKILIPVHYAGQPCDMRRIWELSQRYGFKIIEDASHATGAQYRDKPVGSSEFSDITVFSFHPVKIITTGEGGAALTSNRALAQRMRLYRSHGVTRDADQMSVISPEPWYYEQIALGYNYRMSDLHAALGINQIKRLDSYIAKRNQIANRYNEMLQNLPINTPNVANYALSSFHLYTIQVSDASVVSREVIFDWLKKRNVGVNVHYIPVHLQPYYRDQGFSRGDFPNAESFYSKALTLPCHPSLTEAQQDQVVQSLRKAFSCNE